MITSLFSKKSLLIWGSAFVFALLGTFPISAQGERTPCLRGEIGADVLAGCGGAILKYNASGQIVWTLTEGVGNMGDTTLLPNGNILYADGDAVHEVTPNKETVFLFIPPDHRPDSTFSAQRLEDGSTVVGWNSENKILVVDSEGKITKTIDCEFLDAIGSHNNQRIVRKTAQGTYLVAQKHAGVAAEYDESGKILREMKIEGKEIYGVYELPNREVLTSFLDCLVIFDAEGKEIWRCSADELPELKISYMCSLDVRKNGNIVVGNYAANRDGAHFDCMFEITRDKKVVWAYRSLNAPDSFMGVSVLE